MLLFWYLVKEKLLYNIFDIQHDTVSPFLFKNKWNNVMISHKSERITTSNSKLIKNNKVSNLHSRVHKQYLHSSCSYGCQNPLFALPMSEIQTNTDYNL